MFADDSVAINSLLHYILYFNALACIVFVAYILAQTHGIGVVETSTLHGNHFKEDIYLKMFYLSNAASGLNRTMTMCEFQLCKLPLAAKAMQVSSLC